MAAFGILAFLATLSFAVAQLAVGWVGIEHLFGWWWALGATFLALGFRFTLPLTIGVFFGARDVLGWHWSASLLFSLPGLLFMIPAVLATLTPLFARKQAG